MQYKMPSGVWPALLILALAAISPAAADNAVAPARLEVTANFNAASVYAYFDGDDNANATARMEYHAGGKGDWRLGHPLTRTAKGRLAGSIFGLRPDDPLEVRVSFQDPDGPAAPKPLEAATRTRSDRFPAGTGKTWYVRHGGPDPGDKNVCATLQQAVDLAQPGDTIVLRDGDYFESVTVRHSGRPDAYITIKADDTDRTRVRLVGYDNAPLRGGTAGGQSRGTGILAPRAVPPVAEQGRDGPATHGRDAHATSTPGPARTWQRQAERLFATNEKRTVGTVTSQGRRLYHHESLEALQSAQPPLDCGWWQDAIVGKLYLRPGKDAPPEMPELAIGVLPVGLSFQDCGYWIVENLKFQCYGGGKYSRGIDVVDSRNIVVRRCSFEAMRTGVSLRKARTTQCLVERCTFRDSGIWTWPWKACKAHDVEGTGVSLRGGAGNVARFNTVNGFFNGIDASTWGDLQNESLNRDLDIHDNQFTEIGDDPLEPEGACMNVRFWNNQTRDTLQGISLAPITVGPVYVVRDRYVNFKQGAVKLSVDSRGAVYLYHVLGWTDGADSTATSVCGPWDNMHFRNCILRARKYAIEDSRQHPIGCSFDYCCLFAPRSPFVKWADRRYDKIEQLPAGTFGKHLVRVEPYGADRAGDAAALAPAMIDAGVVIPGINDDFKGKAPDVGPDEVR